MDAATWRDSVFERFTERARRVIILAREEAGRFRHDFVGTEHILLGLIRDGEGIATAVLQRLGLRLETVKAEVERALAGFPKTLTFGEVPFFGNIRVGRYRQPFGMSELTSIRELTFLERPTAFALAPFRQTGVMWFDTARDDRVTYALSGYRYNSDPFGNVYTSAGGYGMASRSLAGSAATGYGPGEMLSATSSSSSRSLGRPWPSRMRWRIFSSHEVPSRQGVHLPQDSRAKKRTTRRQALTASVVSSITTMAPEPSIEPAPPTTRPSSGRSTCSGKNHGADAPPGMNILSWWPLRMPLP